MSQNNNDNNYVEPPKKGNYVQPPNQNNQYQNGGQYNNQYQNNNYQNNGYQNQQYQNGSQQNNGYQNNNYQQPQYQNQQYQNGSQQNNGYQNNNYQQPHYQNQQYQNTRQHNNHQNNARMGQGASLLGEIRGYNKIVRYVILVVVALIYWNFIQDWVEAILSPLASVFTAFGADLATGRGFVSLLALMVGSALLWLVGGNILGLFPTMKEVKDKYNWFLIVVFIFAGAIGLSIFYLLIALLIALFFWMIGNDD